MHQADMESMVAEREFYYQGLRTAKQEAAGLRWTIDELRGQNTVLRQNAHELQEGLVAMQLDFTSTMERLHELQEQVMFLVVHHRADNRNNIPRRVALVCCVCLFRIQLSKQKRKC